MLIVQHIEAKNDPIFRTIWNAFSWQKHLDIDSSFTEICSRRSNWQYANTGSDNELTPNRWQAWDSECLFCWRVYVPLDLDVLGPQNPYNSKATSTLGTNDYLKNVRDDMINDNKIFLKIMPFRNSFVSHEMRKTTHCRSMYVGENNLGRRRSSLLEYVLLEYALKIIFFSVFNSV